MDVVEAIRTRKSIRGFRPDPVSPREILRDILDIATRAPSAMNTPDPGEIIVIAGEVLENIKRGNIEIAGVWSTTESQRIGSAL